MESPPKRVTRARTAATASSSGTRTTRIVTAAAKAKSAPSATTRTTAVKRKARTDETDDEEDALQQGPATATANRAAARSRLRKAAAPEDPAPKATRGRPAKKQATEAAKAETAAPARTSARARVRKAAESEPEAAKGSVASRSRLGSSAATRAPVKKSVKFQDTDKENVAPATKKEPARKEPAAASIRGRPVRRGGSATASRSTRKTANSTGKAEKKPLSPKKVTQIPVARGEGSEDELAAGDEQEPISPMKKSPMRPPPSAKPAVRDPEEHQEEQDDDATTTVNNAILNAPSLGSTAFSSPARRVPSVARETMRSPARKIGAVPFPGSALKSASRATGPSEKASPSKPSLLHSAAKRPPSPIKEFTFPSSPSKGQNMPSAVKLSMLQSPAKRSMPGFKPAAESTGKEQTTDLVVSPPMKPLAVSTPSERLLMEREDEGNAEDDDEEPFKEPIGKINFPGRLSAVLPREADPSLEDVLDSDSGERHGAEDVDQMTPPSLDGAREETPAEMEGVTLEIPGEGVGSHTQLEIERKDEVQVHGDSISVMVESDDPGAPEPEAEDRASEAPSDACLPQSVSQSRDPKYHQLRQKDLNPCDDLDSELESETASPARNFPDTPTSRSFNANGRRSTIGLTSLAEQFGSWSAASPVTTAETKPAHLGSQPAGTEAVVASPDENQATTHFFEDEMESQAQPKHAVTGMNHQNLKEFEVPALDSAGWSDEDLALAQEADAMSAMAPEEVEQNDQPEPHNDGLSDASEEYGDENEMPLGPAAAGIPMQVPVTPERPERQFFPHTTTKVPLKPADDSTPSPLKKRSFSASRVSGRRQSRGLTRSATAPSLSPSKSRRVSGTPRRASTSSAPSSPNPKTPVRDEDSYSSVGTPGLTRPDLNPGLLRGAVVFVEARTSDGGDASGLFIDLLKQMGARCRKTWNWSPRNSSAGEGAADKVGITHVVYKDGRPQTLEKVRRAGGLVQCVGVSWVLE